MKSGLSKREKLLILIVAVILILFVGLQFVIAPLYNNFIAKTNELSELRTEKEMLDNKLANEATARAKHETALKDYEDIKLIYKTALANEDMDHLLTGLCLESGLSPMTLGISDSKPLTPITNDKQAGSEVIAAFSATEATMTLNGSYNSVKTLITKVEGMESLRITRLSLSNKDENGGISVGFKLTMLNESPDID